jgi:uncharacterized protein (DUF2225 family)
MRNQISTSELNIPSNHNTIYTFLREQLEHIKCPNCGAQVKKNNSFTVHITEMSVVFSFKLSSVNSSIINKTNVFDGKINKIRCEDCLFAGISEDFKENKERAKIVNIRKDYSTIQWNKKIFYVASGKLTRDLEIGDFCEIIGITYGEIENNTKIMDDSIIIKKVE